MVCELGSECRETVQSISGVSVRALRGPLPSKRGQGRTHLWIFVWDITMVTNSPRQQTTQNHMQQLVGLDLVQSEFGGGRGYKSN